MSRATRVTLSTKLLKPGASTRTGVAALDQRRYGVSSRLVRLTDVLMFVARLVAVTVAFGTDAPVESTTVPVMLANVVCEYAVPEKAQQKEA